MSAKDGGPAFPHGSVVHVDQFDHGMREEIYAAARGMSLRDYFAAQALTGVLSNLAAMDAGVRSDLARFATDCYRMADAMLAERLNGCR